MTELFYYGNRLKAKINNLYDKYKCFEVTLYKTKKEIYKTKLFFNDSKTKQQLYREAHSLAKYYLSICKY